MLWSVRASSLAGHHLSDHKYADRDGDPHSPAVSGFYYARVGWFLHFAKHATLPPANPVAGDFAGVREIAWLDRSYVPPALALALYLVGGHAWLVWGFSLATTTLAHATFSEEARHGAPALPAVAGRGEP